MPPRRRSSHRPETGEIKVYGQELDEDGNVVREWTIRRRTSDVSPPRPPAGDPAAHPGGGARPQVRGVRRPGGDIVTGISSRATTVTRCSTWEVEACCRRPSRCLRALRARRPLKAYIVEVRKTTKGRRSSSAARTRLIKRSSNSRCRDLQWRGRDQGAAGSPGPHQDRGVSNDTNVDPWRLRGSPRGAGAYGHQRTAGEKVDIVPLR